jgi:hypothetical protein
MKVAHGDDLFGKIYRETRLLPDWEETLLLLFVH